MAVLTFRRDNFFKNIGIILLIVLLGASIFSLYGRPLEQIEEVSLSKVAQEIQAGHVESIEVKQDELTVSLNTAATKLITLKESGVSVTETLRNLGVSDEQLRGVKLNVEKPSGAGFWFYTLVPLLLPFLLLGAFLWFMMRSAQSASNRAMSFGQMTSRPIDQEKSKKRTTFADVAGNEEAKHELEEVVEFLKTPKKFTKLGARREPAKHLWPVPWRVKRVRPSLVFPVLTLSRCLWAWGLHGYGTSSVK